MPTPTELHTLAVTTIVTTSRWYHENVASDVMAARYPHNPVMPFIGYAFDYARRDLDEQNRETWNRLNQEDYDNS